MDQSLDFLLGGRSFLVGFQQHEDYVFKLLADVWELQGLLSIDLCSMVLQGPEELF